MSLRNPIRFQASVTDLTQIDTVLAHLCCWVSHYAYYDTAKKFYQDILSATDIYHIPADDALTRPQGFLFQLPECWVMAFSCTPNLTWLARELLGTRYMRLNAAVPNEYVGTIWGRAANSVWSTYQTILTQISGSGKKLVFTGHSLGGAIAACVYGRFVQAALNLDDQATCYSFGAPRVGTKSFRLRTGRSFAIEIPEDIVTKLPPRSYFNQVLNPLGDEYSVRPSDPFYHHGTLCDLKENGQLVEQPVTGSTSAHGAGLELQLIEGAFGSNPLFGNSLVGARSYFDLWDEGYFNHHSETYLARLEKTLPQEQVQPRSDLGEVGKFQEIKLMPAAEEKPHVLSTWDPAIPNPPKPPEGMKPKIHRVRH